MKQDNSQPIGTPPAGGSWTWDSTKGEWARAIAPAAPAQLQPQASAAAPADPE